MDRKFLLLEPPEKERIHEWSTLRETKYARARIEGEIEELKNQWAIGQFTTESVDETSQLNSEALGRIRGLFYALDFLTKDEEDE